METLKEIFFFINRLDGYVQVTHTGYAEHFIVGSLIGGLIAYLYFEKTNNKFKSVVLGISTAFAVGLAKEYLDPLVGGDKSKLDLIYTILGSFAGVVIFLLTSFLKKRT